MQCLKRVWNGWMDLNTGAWVDYIPAKLWGVLGYVAYGLITAALFWSSWTCLDLRYPVPMENHSEMSIWMRIPFGILCGAAVLYLTLQALTWLRNTLRERTKDLSEDGLHRR